LALGEPSSGDLRDAVSRLEVEALTHELSVVEMTYALCRRAGPAVALRKRDLLLRSGIVEVVPISELADEAALVKCERAISLADCFTIALARVYGCPALFAKRERARARDGEEALRRRDTLPRGVRSPRPAALRSWAGSLPSGEARGCAGRPRSRAVRESSARGLQRSPALRSRALTGPPAQARCPAAEGGAIASPARPVYRKWEKAVAPAGSPLAYLRRRRNDK